VVIDQQFCNAKSLTCPWQQRVTSGGLATFRRKIDVFGSTVNGLRPSKDRRAAGGHF
jgi:hypothetical protein